MEHDGIKNNVKAKVLVSSVEKNGRKEWLLRKTL